MSQHDGNIANSDGLTVRGDINNALAALMSNNSGATAPSTTFAYMWWPDTTTGLMKQRNAADSDWVSKGTLAEVIEDFTTARKNKVDILPGRNMIINGDGVIAQRALGSAVNDDVYTFDRWIVLSDGNGVVTPDQETADLPAGARSAMKLTVAVANKKFGLLQIVEGANCKQVIDDVASLSVQLEASGLDNVRLGILSWTGTEDAPTSDIVSAWNAAGVDPTLVTNWAYENTPANIDVSGGSWAGAEALNASIDTASTKQVAVFIWVDDTDAAVSDTLKVSQVQLEPGAVATPFEQKPIQTELALCQRYAYTADRDLQGSAASATVAMFHVSYPVTMRAVPTVTLIDSTPTIEEFFIGNSTGTGSAIAASDLGKEGSKIAINGFTGLTAGSFSTGDNGSPIVLFEAEL